MKQIIFLIVFLFIFENYVNSEKPTNELVLHRGLPQIKTSLTEKDKDQILNGIQGVAQFFKFLQEKDFFAKLTKISSVAGPIFNVISALVTISFLFVEIESPEMALMKVEFAQLNNRIDKWTEEFNEIKRKIDWSAIQISYSEYEHNIISLHKMIVELPNIPSTTRETHAAMFINNYEINYKASGDLLYRAMFNVEKIYSENLFKASQQYLENDRIKVQDFMVSMVNILTMSMQVEALYIKLKYNNEEASQFSQSLWERKLTALKEKMEFIDTETMNKYIEQYEKDLDKLLAIHYRLSNKDFNDVAFKFFSKKYYWRKWFVLIYDELWGFRDHTVSTCLSGTYRFRAHGRNVIVSSIDMNEVERRLAHVQRNRYLANTFNSWWDGSEHSRNWVEGIIKILAYCENAVTVASIKHGSNLWYYTGNLVVFTKRCVKNASPCYSTFIFG